MLDNRRLEARLIKCLFEIDLRHMGPALTNILQARVVVFTESSAK